MDIPVLEGKKELVARVLGDLQLDTYIENGALITVVDPKDIRSALLKLRDSDDLLFDLLSHMTAVDYSPRKPRFEVVYEIFSLFHKHRIRVKCPLGFEGGEYDRPPIDSVNDIYLTANWHERECHDLFGISFAGHPDLRRLLLPDDWDGYPCRKEYPFQGKSTWQLGRNVANAASMESDLGLE